MAKRAEDRPQTPMQLALALQPFCPLPAAGRPRPRRSRRASRRHRRRRCRCSTTPRPSEGDSQRSSVVFRLPPQTTSDDPIRRRSEAGFPWGITLVGLGALLVVAILGYGIYIGFVRPGEPPIESFTTSQNTGSIKMLKLDGGKFRMGSPETEPGRKPTRARNARWPFSGPFLISADGDHAHAVPQGDGDQPDASRPRSAQPREHRPVEWVTWDEANDFCKKLTEKEKKQAVGPQGMGVPAADRSRVGIRGARRAPKRRSRSAIRFSSRSKGSSGRRKTTRCGRCRSIAIRPRCRRPALPARSRQDRGEPVRALRHARQRGRVVPGLVQTGLSRTRPATTRPARPTATSA